MGAVRSLTYLELVPSREQLELKWARNRTLLRRVNARQARSGLGFSSRSHIVESLYGGVKRIPRREHVEVCTLPTIGMPAFGKRLSLWMELSYLVAP